MTIVTFQAFNSTMTVKAAADAPQGQVALSVQGKGIEYPTGPNSPQHRTSLNKTAGITLNITASSIKTTTATTTTTTYTFTSTTTATEQVTEPLIYAWAINATVATVVLAVVLLVQRRYIATSRSS